MMRSGITVRASTRTRSGSRWNLTLPAQWTAWYQPGPTLHCGHSIPCNSWLRRICPSPAASRLSPNKMK